jgi:hypothetical protein
LRESRVHYHWQEGRSQHASLPPFRTGVSLHSHTLHSRESLDFIERATANTPWLSGAIRKQRAKYREVKGRELDLKRAWWTPPLSGRQALDLEKAQIARVLGMDALVSITDHDNIDAATNLHVIEETRDCPISIEWTIPFRRTFFHVGVHNLPVYAAQKMTRAMNEFTARPVEPSIGPLLEWLGAAPETLIVLNHPMWDENHIGEVSHTECVVEFLQAFRRYIHGLELNGLRPWGENRKAVELAARFGLPVVSGGDRHGREPNACVNLTNACSFAEFAAEVRLDGWSDVLLLQQYREPLKMRILENMCDILQDDPNHALGWVGWSDRVFYLTDEGIAKSLKEFWGKKFPAVVNRFVSLMQLVKHRRVRSALRIALNERQEFAF